MLLALGKSALHRLDRCESIHVPAFAESFRWADDDQTRSRRETVAGPAAAAAGTGNDLLRDTHVLVLPYREPGVQMAAWLEQGFGFRILRSTRLTPTAPPPVAGGNPALLLKPHESRQGFDQKIKDVIKAIRAGRYYQLNLLRFFDLAADCSLERQQQVEETLRTAMAFSREPYRCLLNSPQDGTVLASFSPERFVTVTRGTQTGEKQRWNIETTPIKGTIARGADAASDEKNKNLLTNSVKDRAELSMIIDLMRHDLMSVCRDRSVHVSSAGTVRGFDHVHHLVGKVQGELRPGVSFSQLVNSLCPAGSITGAPKTEVRAAIRELEGRQRGYFMGHMFFIDRDGNMDSSVLIRTAVRHPVLGWSTAVGSGITLGSDPEAEIEEITAKAKCFGVVVDEENKI